MPDPKPTPIAQALAHRAARAHAGYLEAQVAREAAVVAALDAGMTYGKLAAVMGLPKSTVQAMVRRYAKKGVGA